MSVFVVRSPRQRSTSLYSVPVVLQGGEDATKELLPRMKTVDLREEEFCEEQGIECQVLTPVIMGG